MDPLTASTLNNLINYMETARTKNIEKVYTIKEIYNGSEIQVLTDREGFLENVLENVENILTSEVAGNYDERGD